MTIFIFRWVVPLRGISHRRTQGRRTWLCSQEVSLHCLQKLQKAEDELEWETGAFVVGQHLEEPQHASHLQPEPFVAKCAELLLLKEVLKCVVMWDPSSLKPAPRCFFLLLGWIWSVAWWAFPLWQCHKRSDRSVGELTHLPRGSAGSQGWPIQCPKATLF